MTGHVDLKMTPYAASQAPDADERQALRYLVYCTAIALVAFLVWASLFQLDEITRGQGKVIAASREQTVQSLDAGILTEMLVHEGDLVEKDQILLRMDDARSGPVYREAREKMLALSAQAARLRAEAYAAPLAFPAEVREFPEAMTRERQAYQVRKKALEDQIAAMSSSQAATAREIAITAPLVAKGVVSEIEVLRLKRQQADIQAQIAEKRNRYLTEANTDLVRVESELAQTRENVLARADAFKRTVIRSPMQGIVKNVQATTIGSVIQSGQNILEIVPANDELVVEAYVKPAEVAFLQVGQTAVVKLTAYDFNRFGGLNGVLTHISPDTLRDEQKPRKPGTNPADLEEGYYRLLIKVRAPESERNGRAITLRPGMTSTVEIRTGQKAVIEYLFRPLQSVTQALTER